MIQYIHNASCSIIYIRFRQFVYNYKRKKRNFEEETQQCAGALGGFFYCRMYMAGPCSQRTKSTYFKLNELCFQIDLQAE